MGQSNQRIRKSNYRNVPISISDDPEGLIGNSRKEWDVSPDVRNKVLGKLVASATRGGLNLHDTAYLSALTAAESGFNPSAATPPGTTSAAGLGQFLNRTRDSYKLPDEQMWHAQAQINAMIKYYKDAKAKALARGEPICLHFAESSRRLRGT